MTNAPVYNNSTLIHGIKIYRRYKSLFHQLIIWECKYMFLTLTTGSGWTPAWRTIQLRISGINVI